MKSIITNKKELAVSVDAFQKKISALSSSAKKLEWAFPSGDKDTFLTYVVPTDLGELLVAIPKRWSGRQAHLFALGHESGVLAPDVEINIPEGLNRKVSGAYVKSDKQILICHRGGFTAYRGMIRKEYSLNYFAKWLVSVKDGEKQSSLISVAALESSTLANDIAEFVSSVSEMKAQYKAGDTSPASGAGGKSGWRDGEEFEGIKKLGKSNAPEDYEYLHGPLCNALRRKLKSIVASYPEYEVRSNKNIDVAIVNKSTGVAAAIFEVKTSASLSGQLYSGFGQLSFYKYVYGNSETALILVLPEDVREYMTHQDYLKSVGIEVLFGQKERFASIGGKGLAHIVKSSVRA